MYEDLIVSAMPAARKMALKYHGALDPDDAVAIAYFTLVKIAPRYDASYGDGKVTFFWFAQRWIVGALKERMRYTPMLSGDHHYTRDVQRVGLRKANGVPSKTDVESSVVAKVDLAKAINPIRGKAGVVARLMAEDWNWTEIRNHLGISDGHMGNAKHRAFLKMRITLGVK
jgi:hypothetical protein